MVTARAEGRVPAVVLAGGVPRAGEALYRETRGQAKAALEIGGRPMVGWVLDALSEAESVGPAVLVGPDGVAGLPYGKGLVPVASGGTFVDSLYAGIEALSGCAAASERALYMGSDLPLARGAMIDRFVERGCEIDAEVVAGVLPREAILGRFPEARERWLRLREGRFVAADLALFRPAAADRARPHLEALAPRRKSAWRQAGQVGLGLLLRYLLGVLTISALERRIERSYGIRSRVLVVPDPELGLDVDGPRNLAICRRELAGRVPSRPA